MNKHTRSLILTLAVGLGLTLALLALMGRAHAQSGTRYVALGGIDGANDCTDSAAPCSTVQHAVDMASSGEQVLIAAGRYTGVQGRGYPGGYFDPPPGGVITQVVYVNKSLALRGGYDESFETWNPATLTTTLDAQGAGRVFMIAGDVTVTLESLRVTGGDASGLSGGANAYDTGGGIYALNATVTFSACQVEHNTAYYGGGVALLYLDSATLQGNLVQNNTASGENSRGGGVYQRRGSNTTLQGNTIFSNTSGRYGGGVYLNEDANTTLSHNRLQGNTSLEAGGGALLHSSQQSVLRGNLVYSNTAAQRGGGLYIYSGTAALDNNAIVANQGDGVGDGMYIGASSVYLRHTTLARNDGGELGIGTYVATLEISGVARPSYVTMTNSILSEHKVGVNVLTSSTLTLDGVLWHANEHNAVGYGLITISNARDGDPAFASDGYHITASSAALDGGVETSLKTDIDGDLRISGDGPDLGADDLPLYLAPGRASNVLPGEQAVYVHTLANHASVSQTFSLEANSSQGWQVDLYAAGYPSGTLGTLNGSLLLPYALEPGQTSRITATVQVPNEAASGAQDTTTITATGSLAGQGMVRNVTSVLLQGEAPTLEPDRSGSAVTGQWAVYTHTLTNHANGALTFALTAASSSGASLNVAPLTTTLASEGGSAVITVSIRAFSGPTQDTLDVTVVTATAQTQPELWATVTDTTLIIPARLYLPLLIR